MAGRLTSAGVAAAAFTLLALAPAAHAGQASVVGGTLTYTDNPGDSRSIKWARDADSFGISEAVRGLGQKITATAGPGCVVDRRNDSTATYVCSAAGVTEVRIELGDGDDSAEATGTSAFSPARFFQDLSFPVVVLGGDGNDEITGGPLPDTLDGGAGDDMVYASYDTRSGGDTIDNPATDTMAGGPGNDTIGGGKTIDGGEGDDTIYGSRAGATISAGGGKDFVQGGSGVDTIDGGDGPDTIDGADSADKITGGEGDDTIDSGDGNDEIDGGGGLDKLDAGAGADKLSGGEGNDTMDGGDGADAYFGGGGNDEITAADGSADVIDCGAGVDTVTSWDRPKDKASPRVSCEHVPEGGLVPRRSLVLGYAKAAKTGRMKVRFVCVDCTSLKVGVWHWQFWDVPRRPGFVIGSGCPPGKLMKLKRTTLDQFDGVIALDKCQRTRLRQVVALERAGKAKLRRFTFSFATAGSAVGQADIGGRR